MAKAEKRGAYDIAVATEGELDRLKRWTYPHTVSVAVLKSLVSENKIPKNFSLLDIGAGPNTALGDSFKEGGKASYVALDRDPRAVAAQIEHGHLAMEGIVFEGIRSPLADAVPDRFFDVTHARFLLMNLTPEQREATIQETLRVTDTAAIFMDWNWETLRGSHSVERLRKLGMKLLPATGSNPSMGAKKYQAEVRDIAEKKGFDSKSYTHLRVKGNYYNDTIDVCRNIMIPVISQFLAKAETTGERMKWQSMLTEAEDTLAELTAESTKEKPQEFFSAAIGITVATRR